jgi:hypothetical protein
MNNNKSYVEHANITVKDAEETVRFITTAMDDWSVRGKGQGERNGETIYWYHVGNHESYIAIQSGGEGTIGHWQESWMGVKHIGIVVPDLDALIGRLSNASYDLDHFGPSHPFRKNVYIQDAHGMQFEFIEYTSDATNERNSYAE